MRGAVLYAPGDVRVEQRADPKIDKPTDAVIRVSAACGIEKDVTFTDAGHDLDDQIDAAYRAKYHRYPSYVGPMISPQARATSIKLVPRTAA